VVQNGARRDGSLPDLCVEIAQGERQKSMQGPCGVPLFGNDRIVG